MKITVQQFFFKFSLAFFSLLTFFCYFLFCFFYPTTFRSDDLTLFNPVYEFLQTGNLFYPVHGSNSIITVHPPIQYYVVSLLMKLGCNSQVAYSFPFIFSIALLLFINFYSRLSYSFKFAVVIAVQLLFMFPINSIRPDATLAILWFTSLIVFCWAENSKGNLILYFSAAMLLALSSTLHYYGVFGLAGAAVYFLPLCIKHSTRNLALSIIAGLSVVLLPYFFFYVIPNLSDILSYVKVNQGTGGIFTAWSRHLEFYPAFASYVDYGWLSVPAFLLHHFYQYNLVLTVSITPILFFIKATRKFVLAALPLLLSILLFSRGKSEGYLMPEHLVFMFGCAYGWFRLIDYLIKKKTIARVAVASILFLLTFSLTITNTLFAITAVSQPYRLQHHEMHTIRWCAQQLVGDSLFVGGRMSAWYISGAAKWQEVSTLVIHNNAPLSKDTIKSLLLKYDLVAETKHMANTTANPERSTLSSFYLDSILQLRAFIFSDNGGYDSELAVALFSVYSGSFSSAIVTQNEVRLAKEDSLGDHVFLSGFINRKAILLDSLQTRVNIVGLNYFPLPDSLQPTFDFRYRDVNSDIVFMMMPRADYEKETTYLHQKMVIHEIRYCRLEQIHQPTISGYIKNPVMQYYFD